MPEPHNSYSPCPEFPSFAHRVERAHQLAAEGKAGEARALFFSDKLDAPEWERNLQLGQFLLETGQPLDAIEQLSLVLDYAHQHEENALRSVVCHNLAIAYRKLEYYDLAAQFQQYSISWGDLRSANHLTLDQHVDQLTDDAACDLTGRANDAIVQEDYELAEQLLNISLSREILHGNLDAQAADWGNLGLVYGLQGNHLRGIQCLWRAYRLHLQTGNRQAPGHDLTHLAELFWAVGRFQSALRCFSRSIRHFSLSHQVAEEQAASTRLHELGRLLRVRQQDPLLN